MAASAMRLLALALAVSVSSAFAPLTSRRSVVKYDLAKPVPADATDRALEAAILAPCHFLSEPWRFYTCGAETKAKLCALNGARGSPPWHRAAMPRPPPTHHCLLPLRAAAAATTAVHRHHHHHRHRHHGRRRGQARHVRGRAGVADCDLVLGAR